MTAENRLVSGIRHRIVDANARIDLKATGVPPLFEPATADALDAAEAAVGFPLPELLRRLYLEVENGGFGPGAGLIGVENGHVDSDGRTLSTLYLALRLHGWPRNVLPLCDLGGGARSCLDTRTPGDNVVTVDAVGITRTSFTLYSWLEAWVSGVDLDGETFETRYGTIVNPFTRKSHPVKQRGRAKGVLIESFRL